MDRVVELTPQPIQERRVSRSEKCLSPMCVAGLLLAVALASNARAQSSIGPFGGEIRAVTVDPINDGVIYAATAKGGLFKTIDRGARWDRLPFEPGIGGPTGLAIDPADPTRIYVALETYGGVYRSEDAGRSWFPPTQPPGAVLGVFLDPVDSSVLYAPGSLGGVFKSRDRGLTWLSSATGLPESEAISVMTVDFLEPSRIYAGFRNGKLFRSFDAGASWIESDSGLPRRFVFDLKAVPGQSTSILLAATDGGLFRSTDHAATWSSAGSGLPSLPVVSVAAGREGGVLFVGTQRGGVFRSLDGGVTWTAANRGIESAWITSLQASAPGSGFLFAGTRFDGVFSSGDGGQSWAESNHGLSSRDVRAIAVHPAERNKIFAATWGEGIFFSADCGETWVSRNDGLEDLFVGELVIDPVSPNILYAGTPSVIGSGGVFKSSDGGHTWSLRNPKPFATPGEGPSLSVVGLAVDPVSSGTVYVSTNGLGTYKSVDGAASWTRISEGLGQLLVDPRSPATVYLVFESVFKSTDGGRTWVQVFVGSPGHRIVSLAIDPTDSRTLYGAAGCGDRPALFQSSDGGTSWRPSESGLTTPCVMALLVDPSDSRTVYAGTQDRFERTGGVFRSLSHGEGWLWASDGLANPLIWCLAVDPRDPVVLYAGTYGNGIFLSLDGGTSWGAAGNACKASRPEPVRSKASHEPRRIAPRN